MSHCFLRAIIIKFSKRLPRENDMRYLACVFKNVLYLIKIKGLDAVNLLKNDESVSINFVKSNKTTVTIYLKKIWGVMLLYFGSKIKV